MASKHISFSLIFMCVFVILGSAQKISDMQERQITTNILNKLMSCPVADTTSLNKCLTELTNDIRPYMPYGIRLWSLPSLEPLRIPRIVISQGDSSPTSLKALFKRLEVSGLSNFRVTDMQSDPRGYRFKLSLFFPEMRVRGQYEIAGRILIVEINGEGPFWARLNDVSATSECVFNVQNGVLDLHQADTDFNFKNIKFNLENLFGSNQERSQQMNEFLNQRSDDLFKELKPAFAREINRIVINAFRVALRSLPINKWNSAIH